MSGLTSATEQQLGRHLFRTATWAKPTTWWIGLFLILPTNVGTDGQEVFGAGYARVQRNPGDANWGEDGSTFYNLADVIFPLPTADWGLVVGVGLFPDATGGTPQIVAPLTSRTPWNGPGRDPFTGVSILAGSMAGKFDTGRLRFTVN